MPRLWFCEEFMQVAEERAKEAGFDSIAGYLYDVVGVEMKRQPNGFYEDRVRLLGVGEEAKFPYSEKNEARNIRTAISKLSRKLERRYVTWSIHGEAIAVKRIE